MAHGDRPVCQRSTGKTGVQAALADAIGIQQGSISKIVNGTTKNSRHLPRIASELGISVDYLLGKSGLPNDAPNSWPVRPVQLVSMQVALPSERALTRMFDAMLEILDAFPDNPDRDERAAACTVAAHRPVTAARSDSPF